MSIPYATTDETRPSHLEPRDRLLATIPFTERRLDLAGVTTAVLEGGSGRPLVLLHGAGEFAMTWLRTMPGLAAAHRVIAPDLPGHGASGLPHGPLDADRLMDWLSALIDRTCAAPPALVGHLLGGAIAARFAAAHPDRVDRLVLVDSLGLTPFRPSARFALAMVGFALRPTDRSRDRLFRQCFVDLDGLRNDLGPRWDAMAEYALDRARSREMKAALRSMMPRLAMPAIPDTELRRISVPTTLIWGRHDRQVRLGVAEAASQRYGWPLRIIEGAADDPPFEEPYAFLDALEAALEATLDDARGHMLPPTERD